MVPFIKEWTNNGGASWVIINISSSIIHDDMWTKQQSNLGLPSSNYFS